MESEEIRNHDEDTEQVCYCEDCHSLHVLIDSRFMNDGWDGLYCNNCGSTHIGKCTMQEWLKEEERREKILRTTVE